MSLTNESVQQIIGAKFPESATFSEDYGMLIVETNRETLRELILFMRDEPQLKIDFLTTLCALHFPENKGRELGMMYQFHSLINNYRIRLKVYFSVDNPVCPSIQDIYSAANWQERQEYDFFGVQFSGHPNLKRILNVDDMDYFPMRKEYRLEDATRTDKDDKFFGR
jgi:NADH-quinone oxidoreductase subunit C